MASVLTETAHNVEWLLFEVHPDMSRDVYTLITGQNLVSGTVVGVITASGKITLHNNAASDGSEVAAGILYAATNATSADKTGTVVITGNAVAHASRITWKSGISNNNKAAAIAALRAKNLFVR